MQQIIDKLENLLTDQKYIALSLYPAIGETTIKPKGNRLFINEGREGKFEGIDEKFYHELVFLYDSRG